MDRRSLIRNAGIAGVLASGIAPAVHAQAAIRWRLASSFPKSLDTLYGGAEVFAARVKAMSGGKFEISTHAAGHRLHAGSEHLGAAVQGIERLREAGSETPAEGRLRVDGRSDPGREHSRDACILDERATIHGVSWND